MSAHELPPDPRQWPANPFELLGIETSVGPRDVRRAYTRLIRVYKPEQFPEQFRRIREAYEAVLRQVELFHFFQTQRDADTTDETFPGERSSTETEFTSISSDQFSVPPCMERAGKAPITPDRNQDDLRTIWELACSGQEEAAYVRLTSMYEQQFEPEAVCVRLYWLLALMPELDRGRSPCDWLAQGLRAENMRGPLRELYRRELMGNADEALGSRVLELVNEERHPVHALDLLDCRWNAARRLQRWNLIAADLEKLRGDSQRADPASWARVVLLAVDYLAWDPDDAGCDITRACCREIEQSESIHSRMVDDLDRLDFLQVLTKEWRSLRRWEEPPALLVPLLPLSWNRPYPEWRLPFLSLVREVSARPLYYLELFDEMHAKVSTALAQFGKMLTACQQHQGGAPDDPRSRELLEPLIFSFFDEAPHATYAQLRKALLQFCVREFIPPHRVVEVIDGKPAFWLTQEQHLAQALAVDWPLHYVCLARQLFWS